MTALNRIHWPAAIVVSVLVAAVTAVLVFGPDEGLKGQVLRIVVGVLAGLGLLGTSAMPSLMRPRAARAEPAEEEPGDEEGE